MPITARENTRHYSARADHTEPDSRRIRIPNRVLPAQRVRDHGPSIARPATPPPAASHTHRTSRRCQYKRPRPLPFPSNVEFVSHDKTEIRNERYLQDHFRHFTRII